MNIFRVFSLLLVALAVAGCATTKPVVQEQTPAISAEHMNMYAAIDTDRFPVPAPDLTTIDPQYYRQVVPYESGEPAGSIIIDTDHRFLYLQQENGQAMRYGIGVGKEGLEFEGRGVVQYKREWPRWTPTQAMMKREPARYGHLGNGMEPGPENPLGARALYLYKDGRDTLFRIHGTNEDWTIGKAVSSGCIRLLNQDIIDLHKRVPNQTRVVVLPRQNILKE